jgi:ribonuclease BN (tRNA processing enzyme)
VAARLELRELTGTLMLGAFMVTAEPVIHPDPALGYRIAADGQVLTYIPDHEPALGPSPFTRGWTSGAALADGADLLIHDAQYAPEEYPDKIGWGHSSVTDAVALADLVGARRLALFHHDPTRDDAGVDALLAQAQASSHGVEVLAARERDSLTL